MVENSDNRIRRPFPGPGQAGLLVLAFLGVQIACSFVVMFVLVVVAAVQKRGGAAPEMPPSALLAANVLAFATVAAWALAQTRGRWREILLGGRAGGASWLAALPLLLGTTLLVTEGSNLLQMVLPVPASIAKLMQGATDVSAHPVVALLLVVVLAPIGEEFLFRGIILRGLLERLRPWSAIGLSTALFAVMHLNPWQVPAAVGFGVLCGWVYRRTRSLALCILLHLLNNAAAIYAGQLPWPIPGLNGGPGRVEHLPWWLVATGAVALGLGWALFRHTTQKLLEPPPLPAPEGAAIAVEDPVVSTGL